MANNGGEVPWYKTLDPPKSTARVLQAEDVAKLVRDETQIPGKDYVVVDVRRNDFKDFMVKGAINIPAQSIYSTKTSLAHSLGNIPQVIFYCGSSMGRGPRAAAWFQDGLNEIGNTSSEGLVLAGGIKEWVKTYKELTESVPAI